MRKDIWKYLYYGSWKKIHSLSEKIAIKIRRRRLANHNFSIICNNCVGGTISHDLGERFNSPTINLVVKPFLLFLDHFDEAISSEITKPEDNQERYPVGVIALKNGRIIELHFMHYRTFDEAVQKWHERATRIVKDNLFVIWETPETSEEDATHFASLHFSNKVLISNQKYPGVHLSVALDIYRDYFHGKILAYKFGTLHTRRYLDGFDYIAWLNDGIKEFNNQNDEL